MMSATWQRATTGDQSVRLRRLVAIVAMPIFMMPLLLTILALGARWWWAFELCTHFRMHYFLALTVGAVLFACLGRKKMAVLFAAVAIYNGLPIIWLFLPGDQHELRIGLFDL